MPEITRDELGRRIFEMQEKKAVWDAVEKIRRNLGDTWTSFTQSDHQLLSHLLGQIWVSVSRDEWDSIVFSRMRSEDIEEILGIGKALENREIGERKAVDDIHRILTKPR